MDMMDIMSIMSIMSIHLIDFAHGMGKEESITSFDDMQYAILTWIEELEAIIEKTLREASEAK